MSELKTKFTADDRQLKRTISQLEARQDAFEKRVSSSHRRAAQNSTREWQRAQAQIAASQQNIGSTLTRFAGPIAAAFSAGEAIRLADTYTQLQAKLISAKVASADMARVQQELFDIANRNGTEVVSLADLYGNLSMSAGSLGLSQAQIVTATEAVASAMRLSGATTAQSSATILQLGQALAGGTVRAEEYNSMLENSPALVRAVAESNVRWAGDLGKLRKEINDGKVSSEEWAKSILMAADRLKNDAANAPLTVAASMQILENNLVQWIGRTDEALGVTDRLTQAIAFLGTHLDEAATITLILAAALLSRLVAGLIASGVAAARSSAQLVAFQIAMQRSMTGANTAMAGAAVGAGALRAGLSGLMGLMGGPLGVAITALTVGVGFLIQRNMEASTRTAELTSRLEANRQALDQAKQATLQTNAARNQLTDTELSALTTVANLTGQASQLADQYFRVATAAKAARIEQAKLALDEARKTREEADRDYDRAYGARVRQRRGPIASGDGRQPLPAGLEEVSRSAATTDLRGTTVDTNRTEARRQEREARDELTRVQGERIVVETRTTAPDANTRRGSGGGGVETSAEDRARQSQQAVDTAQSALRQAMLALTTTTQERLELQKQEIAADSERQREAVRQQAAEGAITREAEAQAITAIDQTESARIRLATQEAANETAEKLRAIDDARLQNDQEIAALKEAYRQDMAEMAETVEERNRWERAALDVRQEAERDAFDAQVANNRLEWEKVGLAEDEIRQREEALRQAFERQQDTERQAQRTSQDRDTPMSRYREGFKDVGTQIENVKVNALQGLEDGLVSAITRTGTLKDKFKELAKSIIADLARIAIQQTIMKPLANWMSGGGGGGGGGGWFSALSSIFRIGGNASGTDRWRGGLTMVGEAGPELMALPGGAQIAPNNLLRHALNAPTKATSSGLSLTVVTNVDANNALVRSDLDRQIAKSHIDAVQMARQMVKEDQNSRARNRLR